MKVLLSTCRNPDFPTITEYIENAFRKNGWECVFFDNRAYRISGTARRWLPFLEDKELRRMNAELVETVRREGPDLLLVAGGERTMPQAVADISALGVKTALWTVDALRENDTRPALCPAFDHVFCGGSEMIDALSGAPLKRPPEFLPFAIDDDILAAAKTLPKGGGPDIVFVGSLHPELYDKRMDMLSALTGHNLEIYGPGSGKIPRNSPLGKCVRGGAVRPEKWMSLFKSAAITICAHYDLCPTNQAGPRIYETMGSGGFMLSDPQPDALKLFERNVHCDYFETKQELLERVEFYLARPAIRQAISEAGRAEVEARHTYSKRIARMLSKMTD